MGQTSDAPLFSEVLSQSPMKGKLVEIPGLKDMCPTYYKASGSGDFGKTSPFSFSRVKSKPSGSAWTCNDGRHGTEYYRLESGREPSWTDRLYASAWGDLVTCSDVDKLPGEHDHDPVFSTCELL